MRDNLNIINDCLKRHWSDLYLSDDEWVSLQRSLVGNKKYDYYAYQAPQTDHLDVSLIVLALTSVDASMAAGGRIYPVPTEA